MSAYRDASFEEIVRVMIERGITAVPVIDNHHHVVGVVSESDLLARQEGSRRWPERPRDRPPRTTTGTITAGELMNTPAITAHPDMTITQAARLLDQHRIKRLPVVDDEDRLVGIISLRDLLRVVILTGTLRHRSLIPIAVRLAAGTDGVVAVIDELSYADDDTIEAAHPAPRC